MSEPDQIKQVSDKDPSGAVITKKSKSGMGGGALTQAADGDAMELSNNAFPFFVFMLIGCSQLSGWNALLNAAPDAGNLVSHSDMTTTITATYSTVLTLLTIIFIKVNIVSLKTVYTGLALAAICGISFGIASQTVTQSSASPVFHLLGGALALCAALIGSSAFGYAAQFPADYSGAMSAGLGLAGIVTFTVWMIAKHVIFPDNSPASVRGAIWVLSAVLPLISVPALVLTISLFQKQEVKQIFEKTADAETGPAVIEEGTYEKEGILGIIKRVWDLGLSLFFVLYVSLVVFPTLGPLAWSADNWKTHEFLRNILVGTFQMGDFLGRYLPNIIPALMVSGKNACIISLSRAIFIVLATLSFKLLANPFFGAFWFQFLQLLFLSLTNGWLCTVFFLRISERVEGSEAKCCVSSISLLCTFIGITSGQWSGYGIVKG